MARRIVIDSFLFSFLIRKLGVELISINMIFGYRFTICNSSMKIFFNLPCLIFIQFFNNILYEAECWNIAYTIRVR